MCIFSEDTSIYLDPRSVRIEEGQTATLQCRVSKGTPRSLQIVRIDGRRHNYNVQVIGVRNRSDTLVMLFYVFVLMLVVAHDYTQHIYCT